MIASLHGNVQAIRENALVVELGGIGFLVHVPQNCLEMARVGRTIELTTHLHVRETELALYGFSSVEEHDIFLLLLGVSGIGPRTALAVLSTFSPDTLQGAVADGNITALTRIPGIGRKTAERMMLDLRDKVTVGHERSLDASPLREGDVDVINALTSLGYSLGEAREALAAVSEEAEALDERILAALRALGGA